MNPDPPVARRAGGLERRVVESVQLREGVHFRARRDALATEEPLEIRLVADGRVAPVAVTMRTPGADFDLAAGFLFSERILDDPGQVAAIRYCSGRLTHESLSYNRVDVHLHDASLLDIERTRRNFYAASSCGVCGKASIEAVLETLGSVVFEGPEVTAELLVRLPALLGRDQKLFARTGGLHAAGLFDATGAASVLHEDVGRHNAVDKLVGQEWLAGRTPLRDRVLVVSGRVSFEVVQKAARAGIGFVAGVSAPSSLAVQLAESSGMTLVGFLRSERFNIYTGAHRIVGAPARSTRRG